MSNYVLKNRPLVQIKGADGNMSSYADLIKLVVGWHGGQGFNLDQMRLTVDICDIMDASEIDDAIVLDEAQLHLVRAKAAAYPWGAASREIIDFIDALDPAQFPSAPAAEDPPA